MTGRMDVVSQVPGRRRWSDAEKLEILAEAFRPGVRVCDVVARREVSSSLIDTWCKQLHEGELAGASLSLPTFAEVRVTEPAVPVSQPGACSSGFIHIELPDGVRVTFGLNTAAGCERKSFRRANRISHADAAA